MSNLPPSKQAPGCRLTRTGVILELELELSSTDTSIIFGTDTMGSGNVSGSDTGSGSDTCTDTANSTGTGKGTRTGAGSNTVIPVHWQYTEVVMILSLIFVLVQV